MGEEPVWDAERSDELAEALRSADLIAIWPDGRMVKLEDVRMRRPFTARDVDPVKFLEWVQSLPRP